MSFTLDPWQVGKGRGAHSNESDIFLRGGMLAWAVFNATLFNI